MSDDRSYPPSDLVTYIQWADGARLPRLLSSGRDRDAVTASQPAVHVVTIAAANYLPRVRVLACSFFRHHPDGIFDVCIVDDMWGRVDPDTEGFGIIRLGELRLTMQQLRAMTLEYDVLEFSTALKPWVLDAARQRAPGPVLYLDPDIEVFASLALLAELSDEHHILLTPHVLSPIPRDGRSPQESIILLSGMYNLGFMGLGDSVVVDDLLAFWEERLRTDAVSDPANGLFTDQRWIDFVPSLFPHHIHKDAGCNVAYWNAHERPLRCEGVHIMAGGAPLKFIHYSGFDPLRPHWLSKYASENPRVRLSEHPVLQDLCLRYAKSILGACEGVPKEYGWSTLPNGLPMDRLIRRLYRRALKQAEAGQGSPPPDLSASTGLRSFMEWLFEEVPVVVLPRYVDALLAERPDVAQAFPGIRDRDREAFLAWLNGGVPLESPGSKRIVSEVGRRLRGIARGPQLVPAELDPVVDMVGLFRAESGVGEAARRTALALARASVPLRLNGWYSPCAHRLDEDFRKLDEFPSAPSDIALLHVNADVLPQLVSERASDLDGRYRIGVWFWELEEFPRPLCPAFDHVDEVWVATRFQQSAISAATSKPVLLMPVPLVGPPLDDRIRRSDLDLPGGPLFLFMFDMLSAIDRKNPFGLIDAYTQAFTAADGAHLFIKTINGDSRLDELERLRFAARCRPDITIRDGYLRSVEVGALIAACDCYVSLHRSEGLGLTIADAMALGKPTIATAYSGNVDFHNERNGYPVGYSLTTVGPHSAPYDPEAKWAQPDIEDAVDALRAVVDDPTDALRRGRQAMNDLAAEFSMSRCGGLMATRIAAIRRDRS